MTIVVIGGGKTMIIYTNIYTAEPVFRGLLFDQEASKLFQQATRADDFCCDERFGGKTMLIYTNIYRASVPCHIV